MQPEYFQVAFLVIILFMANDYDLLFTEVERLFCNTF